MMIGNNNTISLAYNNLSATTKAMEKTARALSTGLKAATAADDAANLAIGVGIAANIAGVTRAIKNSQDGISLLQTAEGGLNQINSMMQRIRELAIQAANDTLTSQDRNFIQSEIDGLINNINNVTSSTTFNGKRLLDGSAAAVWSSDTDSTKLNITGALTAIDQFGQKKTVDGNYRIEIKSAAGRGQVQKSSPMIISHKDVAMDRSIDTQTGVNALKISNLPAGSYTITDEPPSEARAILTGSYGMDITELDDILQSQVKDSQLTSNASILFEVTDASDDMVTLRATARLLHTDGTSEDVVKDNIMLREGKTINLGEVLGVGGNEAFSLTLSDDTAKSFKTGYKFVYNLNTAADINDDLTTDRLIGIDGGLESANEIIKTNSFKTTNKTEVSARVLFLIDDSGSMSSSINTVKDNITSFINNINANGADEVYAGVMSYSSWSDTNYQSQTVRVHQIGSSNWSQAITSSSDSSVFNTITAALDTVTANGGSVDHYGAITEAISRYNVASFEEPTFFVLVTDTYQEYTGSTAAATKQEAIEAMNELGIKCSVVRPETGYAATRAMADLDQLANDTDGLKFNQSDSSWGTALSTQLGEKIGTDAVDAALVSSTPLSEFEQLASFFRGSNSSVTINVNQDGKSTELTINASDTMETLAEKLSEATGGATTASFKDDENGDRTVSLVTKLTDSSRVTFSGNDEFINALGLRSNFEQKFSLDSSSVMNKNIHFRSFYLDEQSGYVYDSDITLTTDDDTELQEWSTHAKFEASYIGQIPEYDVSLRDINTFYNPEGTYMLEPQQTITLTQGDGKQARVTVYADDTLEELRAKLNDAIADDLGQKLYTDNRDNFVSFVREDYEAEMGSETVAGTFVLRSAIAGKAGEITLSSDNNDLLNALGLNTITGAQENSFTASVFDAHSGKLLASNVAASGNKLTGVIAQNLEIEFDSMANITASWNSKTNSYDLAAGSELYNTVVHITDRSTAFQVGAKDGEDMYINIGDMRAEALGLDKVNVLTRERASESISLLDAAIRKVSLQRTRIGAYQNELEYNTNSLTQTNLHLQESESRIKDADMATEMMNFVKLQILTNTGSSMLAQANQNSQSIMNMLMM